MSSDFPPTSPPSTPLGGLQPVTSLVEIAQSAAAAAPESLRTVISMLVSAITSFARTQHDINRRLWDAAGSLPTRHAGSHKGGADSIAGTTLPIQILPDATAATGSPTLGYAPINHVHPITAATAVGLGDTSSEGDSTSFARANHVHKRDVNVSANGTPVGTRNILNFCDGDTTYVDTTDRPGDDTVDVAIELVTTWDDLRFPAQGINPLGSTAPPAISNVTGMLEFSGSADNIITGAAQLPHAWEEGSTIKPHLHLLVPASNAGKNSRWKFEYNRANIDGNFENAYGSYTALPTITIANPAATAKHLMVDLGDLTMAIYTHSAMILWRITRLANSDAADDDTGVWALLEFDIHYQSNRRGTTTVP